MKILIVISAFLVIASAQQADPHGMTEVHKKCQSDPVIYIDDAILEKLNKHEKVDKPENLYQHLICMVKGLNLLNEDGKVNEEGVKTHVQHVITKQDVIEKITSKCAVNEATPEKTAESIWKCLLKHRVFGGNRTHSHSHSSESSESESDESHAHHQGHGHH